LVAQEAKTKLVTSHHVGERALDDAVELLTDMENRRDNSTELPIFTSDDWDAYKNALVEVYGVEEQPEYKGRGRPPNPKKVPPADLKYGQVVKYREGGEVADVKKRVVFGNEEEVLSALKLAGNSINTSYIERNNLTVRNGVSRVIRKTIDFSKRLNPLIMHLCLFFACFNLVKPYDALKIEIADGRRRWKQRTLAIATNLTTTSGH
jgi:IS1 family transposase